MDNKLSFGAKCKTAFQKFGVRAKEAWRKLLVSLKRRPSVIPMLVFAIAFLYYSLNLTHISDTTAKIQGAGMGLMGFITMLFSMLSLVCFMNAFPNRKPTVWPMWGLHVAMDAAIFICDTMYMDRIWNAVNRAENSIEITTATAYIAKAYNMLNTHRVVLIVGLVLLVLLPVYGKWIRRINTSIEVEGSGDLAEIDISGE